MHLVQLLLPLYDNSGNAFSETVYTGIRRELTERFGGVTAFMSARISGRLPWRETPLLLLVAERSLLLLSRIERRGPVPARADGAAVQGRQSRKSPDSCGSGESMQLGYARCRPTGYLGGNVPSTVP
jgi:hypothetical protein